MLRISTRSLLARQTKWTAPFFGSAKLLAPEVSKIQNSQAIKNGPCSCGCGGIRRCLSHGFHIARRFYCTSGKKTETKTEEANSETTAKTDDITEVKDGEPTPQDEIKQLKSQLLYALADAENARRIAAEDIKKARDFSVKDFAKDMCDVMDSLERATVELSKLSAEDKARLKNVTQGIELTKNILVHNLERHGVRKIKAEAGDIFDYNVHEALFNHTIKEGEKLEPGQIASVVKTGFTLHTRVLRAAQVGVAQKETV